MSCEVIRAALPSFAQVSPFNVCAIFTVSLFALRRPPWPQLSLRSGTHAGRHFGCQRFCLASQDIILVGLDAIVGG